jgi:hypothetical protein
LMPRVILPSAWILPLRHNCLGMASFSTGTDT